MEKKNNKEQQSNTDWFKYVGMASTMIVIILCGFLLGLYTDNNTTISNFPIFKLSFTLLSVFVALYISLKEFIVKK